MDVVFDCYEEHLIKNVTRERRSGKGRGIRCEISKSDLKLPEQWKSFIDVNDNKIALAKFLKEELLQHAAQEGKELIVSG